MGAGYIHVRSTDELDQALDQELERLRSRGVSEQLLTKSGLIRATLMGVWGARALADPIATVELTAKEGAPPELLYVVAIDPSTFQKEFTKAAARELISQTVTAFETAGHKAAAEMVLRLPELVCNEVGLRNPLDIPAPLDAAG